MKGVFRECQENLYTPETYLHLSYHEKTSTARMAEDNEGTTNKTIRFRLHVSQT